MKALLKFCLVVIGFIIFLTNVFANEPTLIITTPIKKIVLTRTQLLNNRATTNMVMQDSRAYLGTKLNLIVLKLCDILKPLYVGENNVIELISSDNFVALIPAKTIMQCTDKTAIAYVAIETEEHPWPQLKYNNPDKNSPQHGTAGPFMIVWTNPEKSSISNEYWAWKLIEINVLSNLNKNNYLAAPLSEDKRILNGYKAYTSNCLGCHTMNHIGKGKIGPDLNLPVSAVERFDETTLKKLVRNPQSVRSKHNDRMSGISEKVLSNQDLDDLVLYLHYMAKHKI